MGRGQQRGGGATSYGIGTAVIGIVACAVLAGAASGAPVSADASVAQHATPDPANVARELTYRLTATNHGPGVPKNLAISDALPASVVFMRLTASAGASCTTPVVGATGTVRCTWPDPPVGSVNTVAIVVKPTAIGTLANTATVNSPGQDPIAANDSATTTIRSIPYALATNGARCTWVGTAGPDTITGTPARDVICGLGGNDVLRGLAGNDVIDGGAGADVIYGGDGADRLYGRAGADRIFGGVGADLLFGGPGRDLVVGGAGNDRARVLVGDTVRGIERRI